MQTKHIKREICPSYMCRKENKKGKKIDNWMVLLIENVPGHLIPHAWKPFPDIPIPQARVDKGQSSPLCWGSTNVCSKCSLQPDRQLPPPLSPNLHHSRSLSRKLGEGRVATQPPTHATNTHNKNTTPYTLTHLHHLLYISLNLSPHPNPMIKKRR